MLINQKNKKYKIEFSADYKKINFRENLFAKLNDDKTKYTQWQGAREAYAYLCWPPMTKSQSVIVSITKKRNMHDTT